MAFCRRQALTGSFPKDSSLYSVKYNGLGSGASQDFANLAGLVVLLLV
jgi:hypothetical protein